MKNPQIENVRQFALETIADYPHLEQEVKDLWRLMIYEIEHGESIQNECHLCIQSITDLITGEDE